MKKDLTDITILLDRSGSMEAIAEPTISGFNKFLHDQKAVPGNATLTVTQFDDVIETLFVTGPIQLAADLDRRRFIPRGGTALLDAIGSTVEALGQRLERTPENDRPAKVVFVIITDGEENSSRRYSREKILSMISHQEQKYSWQFVFLGANMDAVKVATSYGIAAANALTYANNAAGVCDSFASTSKNLGNFRSGVSRNMAYTPEDIAAQANAATSSGIATKHVSQP